MVRRMEPALEANLARLVVAVLESNGHRWANRKKELLFYMNVARPLCRDETVARAGPAVNGQVTLSMLSLKEDA